MAQTSEKAFEAYLEQMLAKGGWQVGGLAEWDKARGALPGAGVCLHREATQPKAVGRDDRAARQQLAGYAARCAGQGAGYQGSLHVLRHGFKFYGKLFRLAYFKPAHALSPDVLALYAQNQLTVTKRIGKIASTRSWLHAASSRT